MDWFKKHADSVSVIVVIATGVWIMIGQTNAVERRISKNINEVKNELVKIETIMILKGLALPELFSSNEDIKK